MGTLQYGSPAVEIDFDDRALTHLQLVITAKLRRGESFLFTWADSQTERGGRSSIWLDSTIPLFYRFYGGKVPTINGEWVTILMKSANSGTGLIFTPEPALSGQSTLIRRNH